MMDEHRDDKGRFAKGHPGGPGRPPAASVHEHRAAMVEAVDPSDIAAIMKQLVQQALEGDTQAAKIILERFFGRPASTEIIERVEGLENAVGFTVVQLGEDDFGGGNRPARNEVG